MLNFFEWKSVCKHGARWNSLYDSGVIHRVKPSSGVGTLSFPPLWRKQLFSFNLEHSNHQKYLVNIIVFVILKYQLVGGL